MGWQNEDQLLAEKQTDTLSDAVALYLRSSSSVSLLQLGLAEFSKVSSVSKVWVGIRISVRIRVSLLFTACSNARIASTVLAIAIPSVCPSVCPSVTRQYCVKTTARSTVQFALSDSKMCLVL